ncbi:MAG: GntR family transcriptional regulator [Methylobacteriaceae bacterium]|nr:GntR family transcriptional regulator [Methylobacteriaceae bacterium]
MNPVEASQHPAAGATETELAVAQAKRAHRPVSTATWLLENLRNSILDGTRPAHSLIRQEELAATYGVSRMPVREALRSLEAEGLVVNRPTRGVVVAPLDSEDALEIFDIRASLESLALRRSIPRFSQDQRAAATLALRTLEHSSLEEASNAHRAFHLSLSAAAGERLQRLIGQYIDACARYLRVEATLKETVDEDRYEHRALLEATLAGDVRGATRLIERHVAGTGNEIAEVLRNRDRIRLSGYSDQNQR